MKLLFGLIFLLLTNSALAGPSNRPTCTLALNPSTTTVNEVFTASWTSQRAQNLELFANNVSLGQVQLNSGSKQFVSTRTTDYALKASHQQHGEGWCYATLTVKEPPPITPTPSCTLSANPSSIKLGETTTVSWTTQYAARFEVVAVSASGSSAMVVEGASGSILREPSEDTSYNGTVTNDQGTTSTCSASVKVTRPLPAPVCQMTLWPEEVAYSGEATLTWSTKNAVKLEAWAIAQTTSNGTYLGLLEPTTGGSRIYQMYQSGHVHAEVYNSDNANANCATAVVKVGPPPQPGNGYLLDDKGAYLLTNPDSTPPNDKLTDQLTTVMRVRP